MSTHLPNVNLEAFAEFPAMFPPPGVTSDFVHPYNHGKTAIVVGGFLAGLMLVFVVNRAYTKWRINKQFSWDDLTCFLAVPFAIVYYVTACLAIESGKVGVHQYNLKVATVIGNTWLLTGYLGVVLSPLALLFTKLTFFLLYLHVFQPMRWLRIGAIVGAVLTTLFYVSFTIMLFVFSTPSPGQTFVAHLQSGEYFKSITVSIPMAAVGFAIDLYILLLPIAGVYRLKLSTRRKIEVSLVFMTGILACVSSLLCMYYRVLLNRTDDVTWVLLPVMITTMAEINVGIICACMPAFSRMFRHHLPSLQVLTSKLFSRLSSRNWSSTNKSNRSKHSRLPSGSSPNRGHAHGDGSYQSRELKQQDPEALLSPHTEASGALSFQTFVTNGAQPSRDDGARSKYEAPQCCEKCGRTKRGWTPVNRQV